jgi:hypothetical protein
MKTGEICRVSGPYRCGSHRAIVVFFKRGDKFPACPDSTSRGGHSTVWYALTTTDAQ